ncbi:MAG: HNH endonuclease [Terracidiphilus sp.]
MATPRCALCDAEITNANDSQEHIILNAIGGTRKVRGVYCVRCNSDSGSKWDSEAFRQLEFLASHLGIVRERGYGRAVELVTLSGRAVRKHPDGHLSFPRSKPGITSKGEGVEIQIQATTRAEAEKILRGLKRKYPKLDSGAALASIDERESYLAEPVKAELTFGGGLSGRSAVKSALTLAVSRGVNPQLCNLALNYLRSETGDRPFGHYGKRDLVMNRPPGRVFHCVAIAGDPLTKRLTGYVELFTIFRMVIALSDSYTGPAINVSYAIDPIVGEELDLQVNLAFSADELRFAVANEDDPTAQMLEAADMVARIARDLSFEREFERVSKKVYREAVAALKLEIVPGQRPSPETAFALAQEITRRMAPFLAHHADNLRRGKPQPYPPRTTGESVGSNTKGQTD